MKELMKQFVLHLSQQKRLEKELNEIKQAPDYKGKQLKIVKMLKKVRKLRLKKKLIQLRKKRKEIKANLIDIQKSKQSKEEAIKIAKIFNSNHDLQKTLSNDGETLCMSEYYLKLAKVGVPQPKTAILEIEPWAFFVLENFRYNESNKIEKQIKKAKNLIIKQINDCEIPKPFFFKTGTRSLKHASCEMEMFYKNKEEFIDKLDVIFECILQNYDNDGYSSNQFIFREILDIDYSVMRSEYMPLLNEYRLFFQDNEIQYMQPYYDFNLFKEHRKEFNLNETNEELIGLFQSVMQFKEEDLKVIREIISKISKVYKKGAVDLLKDKQGKWWLIDMQPQSLSYGFNFLKNYQDFDNNVLKYLQPMINL